MGRAGGVRGDKGEDFGRERRVGRKGSLGRGSSHGRVCCRGGRGKSLSSVNQPSDACYGRTPVQAEPASDSTPSAPRFARGNHSHSFATRTCTCMDRLGSNLQESMVICFFPHYKDNDAFPYCRATLTSLFEQRCVQREDF